jgi:HEAT repeat protein
MRSTLVAMLLFLLPTPTHALGRMYSLLELAQQSDLVFAGTVERVDEKTATVRIEKILAGSHEGERVVVTPITASTDVGPYVNIKAGEAVLMFTKTGAPGDPITVVGGGQGNRPLDPATREADITAAARVLEIAALKEEDAINRAMLAEATSANLRLRLVACGYVSGKISDSKLRNDYAKELVTLLDNLDPLVHRAALDALRFVDAPSAIPRIIALTRSTDAGVVNSASLTLGRYRTPECTAALIALTENPQADIRARAVLDLGNNRHDLILPELVRSALVARLEDQDPKVRAVALTALVYSLRDGQADELIPRIAALLQDPTEDVAASAARALGETRNPAAIGPLLEVLQRPALPRNLQYFTLQALDSHYSKDKPDAQPIVDKQMELVITALKNDTATAGFGPAFQAVGILDLCRLPQARAALEWAAAAHPNSEVRDYAQRSLKR